MQKITTPINSPSILIYATWKNWLKMINILEKTITIITWQISLLAKYISNSSASTIINRRSIFTIKFPGFCWSTEWRYKWHAFVDIVNIIFIASLEDQTKILLYKSNGTNTHSKVKKKTQSSKGRSRNSVCREPRVF